ncbi:MAG: hypothetical protein Dbin4_02949, partial [Alphaproteobacteria bacterium]|nr:hypothetical protein [Alphaproteobacteria bacterium]
SDTLYGYAWPKCVRSGESSEFRVTSVEPYKLELWRYGWEKEFIRGLGWHDERPFQDPHPPIYMAADSPDSIRKAGAQGYTIMMGPHASNADCKYKRGLYQQVMEENGHVVGDRDLPIVRYVAVAETRAQAEALARASSGWTVGAYANADKTAHLRSSSATILADPKVDPVERYLNDVVILGTASEVLDRLKQLEEEIPMNYLMAAPMGHDSFMRFTRDVLPKLV